MKGDEGPAGTPGVAIKGEKVHIFSSPLHMYIRKYFMLFSITLYIGTQSTTLSVNFASFFTDRAL